MFIRTSHFQTLALKSKLKRKFEIVIRIHMMGGILLVWGRGRLRQNMAGIIQMGLCIVETLQHITLQFDESGQGL